MGAKGDERVLEVLAGLPRGRLLDVPAGAGPVTAGARGLGYRVVGLELFPGPGFEGVVADACARLPFADESFEVCLSMEGIEHFENQTGFLRECARVLAPGGRLVLTTPNVLNLNARVSGFLTAQRNFKHGLVNEASTLWGREGGRLYHGHAYLIDAVRLRYALAVVGLRLEEVRTTKWSPTSLALAPLAVPIWLATRLAARLGRRYAARKGRAVLDRERERELLRAALAPAVLFGKKLVVVARKEEPAVAARSASPERAKESAECPTA